MCPQRFAPDSFDADKLRILQQVFDSTWEQVLADHPSRDGSNDEDLRTQLAKLIVLSAEEGISDAERLRAIAAETLAMLLDDRKRDPGRP